MAKRFRPCLCGYLQTAFGAVSKDHVCVVTCRLPLVQYLRSCSFGYLQTAFGAVPKIMFVWCGYLQTAFGAVWEKNTRGHRVEARANELVDVVVHQLSHLMKNVL